MNVNYNFPVSNPHDAIGVTDPFFEPDLFENDMYVSFDELRTENVLNRIKINLGIIGNSFKPVNDYQKIVVSGHRGCGKTSELKRLQRDINKPDLYCSIFLPIEEEYNLADCSQEIFIFLVVYSIIERLDKEGIGINSYALNEIVAMFGQTKIQEQTGQKKSGTEVSAESSLGFKLFGIGAKADLKTKLSLDKAFTDKIVRVVQTNRMQLIEKLNLALLDIRHDLILNNKGQDLVFILDGTEKISFQIYQSIFMENANLIRSLNCHFIICLPIKAWYQIENSPQSTYRNELFPMLSIKNEQLYFELMKLALSKRIDANKLLNQDALDYLIRNAAGCLRQMYKLINFALIEAAGEKVDMENAIRAVCREGKSLYESLNSEHFLRLKEVHRSKELTRYGDKDIVDLLYGLQLLKYKGNSKVNPVILEYLRVEHNTEL